MNTHLEKFIAGPVIQSDKDLADLLIEADAMPDCVLYAPDFYAGTVVYAGENIISILGIKCRTLMEKGIPGLVALTSPMDLPRLMSQMANYMHTIKKVGYDLSTILIQHYKWTTLWPEGKAVPIQGTGVVMTFNEYHEFRVGIGFLLLDTPEHENVLKHCQDLLIKIKNRHNKTQKQTINENSDLPYIIQFTDQVYLLVTRRERQVLACLAKGLSTKETALVLQISDHTVESHRKNLVQKFAARNVAELIKKASKVFWLE